MGLDCTFVVQIWTIKPCFLVLFNGFQWTTAIPRVSGMVLSSLKPSLVLQSGRKRKKACGIHKAARTKSI